MALGGIFNFLARGFQFLWALLLMALTGNIIAEWGSSGRAPNIIGYSMFCAAFAMLSLLFLIPATFKESLRVHAVLPFVLDVLNLIFWFCGAVALAAELHVHSCNDQVYLSTNRVIHGAADRSGVCREAQASTAFLWFGWAAFLVSTIVTGTGLGGSGSVRTTVRRGPAMSQV